MDEDFIMVQIPARENGSIGFVLDKSVNNDSAYHAKYIRRLAWALIQMLPMHAIEHLIHELMLSAQEIIMRGARMEAAQKGKRLHVAVKDEPSSPFPGSLQFWFDDQTSAPKEEDEEEFRVGEDVPLEEDEEYE
jgi:hypothetical protein